ncbi:hypothetical protein F4780DRAFT_753998 [Xylariomycetidae sp. FL0641]|nr:hypothetical protein F4780DRAFT_753998 [Xylariomycetidae sp. FL0641]
MGSSEHNHMEDELTEDVFLQDDLGPSIAEHATQCRDLIHRYMLMPEFGVDPTIIDDQRARLAWWAADTDVYAPLNVSLDYRLRFSPIAVDIIHEMLDLICHTLLSLRVVEDGPSQIASRKRQRITVDGNPGVTRRADDDASDSESDPDPAVDNRMKIYEIMPGTLRRIYDVTDFALESAKANRSRKIEKYRDDEEANKAIEELRLYTRCYIEHRFPKASEALRSALVEANALRLRRLCYQRSHRRRIDLSVQHPQTSLDIPFAPTALPEPAKTKKRPAPSPAPATSATTARETAVAALYAKSPTELPRATSILGNDKLSFPPLPPPPRCPYCAVVVEFKNTATPSLWQDHVIADLEPFICVFPPCLAEGPQGHGASPLTFETSKAWSSHMGNAHGHTWVCEDPRHDFILFDQELKYQKHCIQEHGVPEAHVETFSNVMRRAMLLDKVSECPFGDDFQPSGEVEPSAMFSSEALKSHIADHMQEIALLALQKLPGDEDEKAESVASDQPFEDDGPAGALGITRASMKSILDDKNLDFQDEDAETADGNVRHREEDISARVPYGDTYSRRVGGHTRPYGAQGQQQHTRQQPIDTWIAAVSSEARNVPTSPGKRRAGRRLPGRRPV